MAFVNGFDADKAQAYNELRQASPNLSQAQLFNQAGISALEQGYYQPSPIGFLIQNPTPTNVNTTLFAPSGTLVTAANFPVPSPQQTVTSEFNRPLNLGESNLSDLPNGVSSSANINPNTEPVNEFARPLNLNPAGLDQSASGVNLGGLRTTQEQGVNRDQAQFLATQDWRFRISLAPGSNYLYNDPDARDAAHILNPLQTTQGVIFPYVPQVAVSYNANYEQQI